MGVWWENSQSMPLEVVYKCWDIFSWLDGDLGKGELAIAEKTVPELYMATIIHRINASSDNIIC